MFLDPKNPLKMIFFFHFSEMRDCKLPFVETKFEMNLNGKNRAFTTSKLKTYKITRPKKVFLDA